MAEEKKIKWISGFWRRVGALFIDSIVLGLVGLGMGLFLEEYFVEIGAWGRLIGFAIALTYFSVMNSEVANGQTIGKKALKIRVVNVDNNPISLIRAFGRYCIIGIPFFLNGVQFPDETMTSAWIFLISPVIFGGLFSIIYLYIFNRATRQSLHDLACSTYVVNDGIEKQDIGKLWRLHIVVVGLFLFAMAIVPLFTLDLTQQEPFADLSTSRKSLMRNPSVKHVTISYGKTILSTVKTGTKETKYVSAQVFLKKNEISDDKLAYELANLLVGQYRKAIEKDIIQINLIYGYDIGIASK